MNRRYWRVQYLEDLGVKIRYLPGKEVADFISRNIREERKLDVLRFRDLEYVSYV